jgi:hypothetical protein
MPDSGDLGQIMRLQPLISVPTRHHFKVSVFDDMYEILSVLNMSRVIHYFPIVGRNVPSRIISTLLPPPLTHARRLLLKLLRSSALSVSQRTLQNGPRLLLKPCLARCGMACARIFQLAVAHCLHSPFREQLPHMEFDGVQVSQSMAMVRSSSPIPPTSPPVITPAGSFPLPQGWI